MISQRCEWRVQRAKWRAVSAITVSRGCDGDKVGGLDVRVAGCVALQVELESRPENVHRVAGAFSADAVALSNAADHYTATLRSGARFWQ